MEKITKEETSKKLGLYFERCPPKNNDAAPLNILKTL